jgi:chemotaxis protein MotB
MFPEGSKYPFELTRKAIAAMAPSLTRLPNRIRISGHTAAGTNYANPRYGPWELSFDRANVARQILEEFGLSNDRIESVVGRGDADPFFPNEPFLSANQRVSILLVYENPPVPVDLKP